MQLVLFHILYMHRLKCPQAHVERQLSDFNPSAAYVRQGFAA